MKIGAIIQARYDSQRLPGKVLLNLPVDDQKFILNQIINRLKAVTAIDKIIVATSDNIEDDIIYKRLKDVENIEIFRGSKSNVLKRFVDAGEKYNLDILIRLTGDNPVVLIDILKTAIEKHLKKGVDYSRNLNLPIGTSFEIVSLKILQKIEKLNPTIEEKEHVTLFIKNHRDLFHITENDYEFNFDVNKLRLTVDYPSDYLVLNFIFQKLRELNYEYDLIDIFNIYKYYGWLEEVNASNFQKKSYNNFSEELFDAIAILEKFGFGNVLKALGKINTI